MFLTIQHQDTQPFCLRFRGFQSPPCKDIQESPEEHVIKYNNLQRKITGTLDTRDHSGSADGNENHGSDFSKLGRVSRRVPDTKTEH
jgi:hypothetical protein